MTGNRRPLAVLIWCCCLSNPPAPAAEGGVSVRTLRRVPPVLIRNDHNPLLQVVVEVRGDKEVRLRAVHFTLDRCDDLADLASLELFAAGDGEALAASSPSGKPTVPARAVTFRGDLALRRGRNVFWL